jgi:hypothetical protein
MTAALSEHSSARAKSRTVLLLPAPHREPPFDDEVPRHLHVVGALDQQLPFDRAAARTPLPIASPAARAGWPDPGGWGRRLLVGLIETAGGRRPLNQLAGLMSRSVAGGVGADFERCAQLGQRHWTHAATVRTVRVSEPADGVAELSATVGVGPRVRAVAMRLEIHGGRWRCTRLQLG